MKVLIVLILLHPSIILSKEADIIQIKSTRDEFDNQIGIIGITPKVNYVYEGIFSSLMSALDETLNWMQRIGLNIIGLFSGKMNLESL